jgi:hypothetical protein
MVTRIVAVVLIVTAGIAASGCASVDGGARVPNAPISISASTSGTGVLYAGILNSSPSRVLEYSYPYERRTGKITNGIALGQCCSHECNDGMAVDAAGELFVANYGDNTITGYATRQYGHRKKAGTLLDVISADVSQPCGVVTDSSNDVFVTMGGGHYGGTLYEYAPPYTRVTRNFDQGCYVHWLAFNAAGNLFVQACDQITEYVAPHWRKRNVTIGLDDPAVFTFDANDNLFVANVGNSTVTEYACCNYDEAPIATLSFSFDYVNQLLAYGGYVCALNGGNSIIICEQPGYSGMSTITRGLNHPGYAIVDPEQNLLVSNCCPNGSVAIYKWPWFSSSGGNLSQQFAVDAWPIAYVL